MAIYKTILYNNTIIYTIRQWRAGRGGTTPPPAGNFWRAHKWKGGADPAPNFESEWEKTHLKKYSYFRQEKMCL
jgi:hypothetical protein